MNANPQILPNSVTFFVPGIPRPKGSTKSFWHRHTKKLITTRSNPDGLAWESRVTEFASKHCTPRQGPVSVEVRCYFQRPKSHFNKHGLKATAPSFHLVSPDGDKLLRSIKDALTAVAYRDDKQVWKASIEKVYTTFLNKSDPGATIRISYQ